MPTPVSSTLTALKAYNRPDQKTKVVRPQESSTEKASQSRRMAPALSVQLSAEAQKLLSSTGSVQKVATAQKTSSPINVNAVKEYENGVGRREAPLSEMSVQKPTRLPRIGSTLDIKV